MGKPKKQKDENRAKKASHFFDICMRFLLKRWGGKN